MNAAPYGGRGEVTVQGRFFGSLPLRSLHPQQSRLCLLVVVLDVESDASLRSLQQHKALYAVADASASATLAIGLRLLASAAGSAASSSLNEEGVISETTTESLKRLLPIGSVLLLRGAYTSWLKGKLVSPSSVFLSRQLKNSPALPFDVCLFALRSSSCLSGRLRRRRWFTRSPRILAISTLSSSKCQRCLRVRRSSHSLLDARVRRSSSRCCKDSRRVFHP